MSRLSSLATRAARMRSLPSTLATAAMWFATAAYAALPTTPAGVPTGGTMLENFRDYIGMAFGLLALVITGLAFFSVSGGALVKFGEWRQGKAELGDLKMVFIVGGLLLLVVIYLVTEGVKVIATSGTFAGS
jgi:integrating conjugative element membrane protein (TIGR03745 family)